jgi:hypothetical protein
MAFTVSALTNYTNENEKQLVTDSVLEAKTASLIKDGGNIMTGVKSAETINVLETDAVFQAGGTCGFAASGTTTFSQRTLTIGKIKVNEILCMKDLEPKYLQKALKDGSHYENTSDLENGFAEEYSKKKAEHIANQNESIIWSGDTTSGDSTLARADGFRKIIKAAAANVIAANAKKGTGTFTTTNSSTTVTGQGSLFTTEVAVGDKLYSGSVFIGTVASITNATTIVLAIAAATGDGNVVTTAAYTIVPVANAGGNFATPILATTGITAANVIAQLQSLYNAIPNEVVDKDDLVFFVGFDVFKKYVLALTNANLFHYVADKMVNDTITLHGTNIKIVATPGLNGTNEIYAMRLSNMYLGTDMLNEEEKFRFWYSQDDDNIKFAAEWKIGVQVAFPHEITYWLGA